MFRFSWSEWLSSRRPSERHAATRRRSVRRHPVSSEALEARQLLAATPIAGLSDEFNDATTLAQWNEIAEAEGWGPRGMQLNELSINTSQPGRMVLQPHTGGWYEDWRGTLVYKEVTGDFVATTRVRISDRDDIGNSDEDSIPGDGDYSLGGLMIRTPRDIENGAADWAPGSRQDDGTNNGENYIFLSMGFTTGDNRFSFEVKSTRNSSSHLQITPLSATPDEVELQIARIGTSIITLYRLEGGTEWTVHRRYSRPDMPPTMQIGMVAYTDWEKLNDFAPVVHNANALAPGAIADPTPWQPFHPDITAAYDYTRFARPDVPAALAGADLSNPGEVPDRLLLTFLGSAANLDPNAVPAPDGNPEPDLDPDAEPALHVTRVGANLSHVVDWDPAWIFKDAFQRARPWGVRAQNVDTGETTWQFSLGEGPELQLDESGWITALPQWQHSSGTVYQQQATTVVFTGHANQPAGIYTAEWDGNGTLQMPFVIESGVTAEGRNYALIDMPFNAHFTMDLTSTDPADPVRNIDLWMPDYNGQSFVGDHWQPGDSGSPFHPLFLERVDDFDTLRFMDWMNTNNSDIVTWNDRRLATHATQSDGDLVEYLHTNGVAAEYLIELANTVDANPWFNMPHQADDDFVRNFATLVRDTLDPDLTIHVEWSNELWNAQFAVNQWLQQQMTLPENAGLDFFQIAGREIQRDFDIWSEVFEGQEHRLVRVVAGQQANVWLTEQLLINVDGRVDAVSATAYAGIGYEMALAYDANTTADDIIDDLLNVSIPWASARLQEHQALVQQYEELLGRDLRFVTYESGSHVFAAPNPFLQSPALDAALEAMHSPRMYDVYQTLLGAVHAAGVDLYNEFNFTSHDGANFFGTYGLLHDMTTPLSEAHQLRSLLDFAVRPNDNPQPALPTVTIAATDANAAEAGQDPAVFTVTRTGDTSAALTVNYTVGGTATSGNDYTALSGSVQIPAGQASATVTVTPIDDSAVESDETITLMIASHAAYTIGDANPGTATLASDDVPAASPLPVLLVIADQQDFYFREYNETRVALETQGLQVVVAATTTSPSFPHPGTGQGSGSGMVTPDVALGQVDQSQYSAIAFVGGWGASQYQYAYNDPDFNGTTDNYYLHQPYNGDDNLNDGIIASQKVLANNLINEFLAADKLVAAICHGVTVLAWARVDGASPIAGRHVAVPSTVTSPDQFYNGQLRNGGYLLGQYDQVIANGGIASPISGSIGNPSTVADDVVVDGRIITAENFDSATLFGAVIAQAVLADSPNGGDPPPVENHAPVIEEPTLVEITEGSLLTLAIVASDPDAGQQLQYQLGEDAPEGVAIDAVTGVITWQTPDASDADFYGFTVIVSDSGSPSLSTEVFVDVTVLNAAPVAAMEGPATAVRGHPRQFTLLASDLSAIDQNADFTFDIDWNGDGSIDETVTGPSGLQVEHTFEVYGAQRVLVTAWDRNEMPSDPVEWNVWVATAELQQINGQSVLVVGATTGTDNVTISPRNARMVDVRINRTAAQRFANPDRVIVYGQAGHDRITLDTRLSMPAELYGEAGNDTLTGGSGSDILIGGDGNDWLYGQEGRDVLIGGDGVDRLRGAGEQDLIIAGRTSFDARPADLRLIQGEWTSGRNYPTRVANLTGTAGGSATRFNGSVLLAPSTVFEDESVDLIFGGAERDFFFAALNELNDRRPNESVL